MRAPEDRSASVGAERAEFERRRRRRRERRRRRLILTGAVTLLALLLVGVTAWFTYQRGMRGLGLSRGPTSPQAETAPEGAFSRPEADGFEGAGSGGAGEDARLNVLVLGVDDTPDNIRRTDTMMLVSYDPAAAEVGVLSIPRDTRVEIPGRAGFHRVNAAHAFGGPALAVRTVAELLDVRIDHYVAVDFAAFEEVVDALGGVTMLVERPMRYDDHAQGLHIDIQPGLQTLNGEQALHYVRFRADRLGDVSLVDPAGEVYDGRVKRQLDFVQAVAKEALSWKTLPKLPQLLPKLFGSVRTDMGYDRALALVVTLRDFENIGFDAAVLPGVGDTVGGASYWIHDPARTRHVVDQLIRGRTDRSVGGETGRRRADLGG